MKTDSWYQINQTNVNKALAVGREPLSPTSSQHGISVSGGTQSAITNEEEEEIELDIEEVYKSPINVTRKNKIICTVAYTILILGLSAYIVLLGYFHAWFPEVKDHYEATFATIYFVFASDIIASGVGIWTCLAKTGPKPMVVTCAWLLISSLVDLCVSISLTYDDKALAEKRIIRCNGGKENTHGCQIFSQISLLVWCSLSFALAKIIVIILCRINYPSVFNWLAGKHVLVDEELMKAQSDNLSRVGTLGGAFHSPCDVTTLTARGALGGKVRKSLDSHTIIVMKNEDKSQEEDDVEGDGGDMPKRMKRRSTLVSLSAGRR